MAKRSIGFGTWKPWSSYMVIDQKASAGGSLPLSKCSTYLLAPLSGLPLPSTKAVG
jgi:hypothetical protein